MRNTSALGVEQTKVVSGLDVALRCGFEIPFPGRDVILRNSVAVMVENAKVVLGPGDTLCCGF